MITPDLTTPIPDSIGAVHFVGIGGSGMSGIARLFLAAGHRVSGSDRSESSTVTELRRLGATVAIGHDAQNIGSDVDTVVVTSAIWPDNPELGAARERELTVLHRSQALAWLTRAHRVVSIAGAHGKTTTTGMLVTALRELGADPSFVNGGIIAGIGTSAGAGRGDLFVLEADESDGSFLLYDTAVGLITNIEGDHVDHYGSADALAEAFVTFATQAGRFVAVSADDPTTREVTAKLGSQKVITFGQSADAHVRVTAIDTSGPVSFTLVWEGREYPCRLAVFGRHNALNAAGAVAVMIGLGYDPSASVAALSHFTGTARRFELHGTPAGVRVYDDYAHHPTEVAAVLTAARAVSGAGRIIAVHQPHLYSRTQRLAGQFAHTLEASADLTVVLDVCGAREDPIDGVTGELVSQRFDDPSRVYYAPEWSMAVEHVGTIARPGDLVITLGCGDVNLIIPRLLKRLERNQRSDGGTVGSAT